MQIDVFALLAEARQRIAANIAAIEAQRDFWLASADLDGRRRRRRRRRRSDERISRDRRRRAGDAGRPLRQRRHDMISRRGFLGTRPRCSPAPAPSAGASQAASIPGGADHDSRRPCSRRSFRPAGPDYQPVVTLNGWTLPWRMNGDWKEFHLVAEPVVREMAPGMKAHLWGYNGQSPGPTIEAVEGDKVRIFVTNKLPEHTTIHWHGMLLPNGMDGVGGLTQPHIKPGKTFVYEFAAARRAAPSCTTRTPTRWCRWRWA